MNELANLSRRLINNDSYPESMKRPSGAKQYPVLHDLFARTNASSNERGHEPYEEMEPEEYPEEGTEALWETFYTNKYLPCYCSDQDKNILPVGRHSSVLRLGARMGVPGNGTHYFFDSIIKKSASFNRWTAVQFQLPRDVEKGENFGELSTNNPRYVLEDVFCTTKLTGLLGVFPRSGLRSHFQTNISIAWNTFVTYSTSVFDTQVYP